MTRGGGGEDALAARLVALGATVLEAPSIAVAPPESWDELDAALREVETFAWIAFASGNAVDCTVARAAALGVPPGALARPRLAAVGAATARRVAERIRAADLVPRVANGAALAAELGPRVSGRRVLVPRAAGGRPELVDGLSRAGATVAAPVAYRTVPVPPEDLRPLADALASGTVDAVVFASPSAVRSVVAALGPRRTLLGSVTLAAIGPTTASALRDVALHAVVQPDVATGPALADALADHLSRRSR